MAASRSGMSDRCSCVSMRIWIDTGSCCSCIACRASLPLFVHASCRIYLPQVIITGGPHPHLTNIHGFLTNLVRHPFMLVSVGLFTLLSFCNGKLSQAVRDLPFVSI